MKIVRTSHAPFRWRALWVLAALGVLAALVVSATGCSSKTTTTTAAAGGTSTSGAAGTTTTAAAGAIKAGGTLRIGSQPGNLDFDPAFFAGNVADIALQHQALEPLVQLGPDFTLQPVLATKWETTDSKVWKFTLRDGVTFSNGTAFTADDVVYTMKRLMDPKSSVAKDLNIDTMTADDPTHVSFTLKASDDQFPAALTDYRVLMLSKDVKDPKTEMVGTGPFVLESSAAESGAVFKKNPTYWGKDDAGQQLPYLDGLKFVYTPDMAGQIEGLQGGSIDWVGGLTAELKQTVGGNTNLKTINTPTNYCFELQIRTDQEPGSKLAFRQAIMAGTDRKAIVDLVAPGVADPGNGTLVGPGYKAYYSADQVAYDPAKAKQLLADAGYASGVKIRLVVQTSDVIPAIATAWQAQMKAIGITVDIAQVPPDVFYAEKGQDNWYQAPFSIVDYGTRAVPIFYFRKALTSDAVWNYSRWKNPDFDALVKQIGLEQDTTKRADLYKQAQKLLQDQVPMMNFLVNEAVAGQSAKLDGVALAPDWPQTLFRTANLK
jgi:peptide/nickel transport system substrate-binding protein